MAEEAKTIVAALAKECYTIINKVRAVADDK